MIRKGAILNKFFTSLLFLILSLNANCLYADGTHQLGELLIPVPEAISGVEINGVGLMFRNDGELILDIPLDATIDQVITYWEGVTYGGSAPDDTITLVDSLNPGNSHQIVGTFIGGEVAFGGAAHQYRHDSTYLADLGFIHPGINKITVEDLEFNPLYQDGAGIIVLYTQPGGTGLFELRDGHDYAYEGVGTEPEYKELKVMQPVVFEFEARDYDREASIPTFWANVQEEGGDFRPNSVEITIGNAAPQLYTDELTSNNGAEWDTKVWDILIPAGASSVKIQGFSRVDDGSVGGVPASFSHILAGLHIPNASPTCDAGGPYKKESEGAVTTITLDGSGSDDPDGDALSYLWTHDCGANASIANPNAMITEMYFTDPSVKYSCSAWLTVSSSNGTPTGLNSADCSTTIEVEPYNDNPPVCNAGGSYTADCQGEITEIQLDGSGSYDPDGDPLSYLWTTDCEGASFDNDSIVDPILYLPDPGEGKSLSCNVFLEVSSNGVLGTQVSSCSAKISLNGCVYDCLDQLNGPAVFDECGVCDGDNSTCTDCLGVIKGDAQWDGKDPSECCPLADINSCGLCGDEELCQKCEDYSVDLYVSELIDIYKQHIKFSRQRDRKVKYYCGKAKRKLGKVRKGWKKRAVKMRNLRKEMKTQREQWQNLSLSSIAVEVCDGSPVACPDLYSSETSELSISETAEAFRKASKKLYQDEQACRGFFRTGQCESTPKECLSALKKRKKEKKQILNIINKSVSVVTGVVGQVPDAIKHCFE